MVVSICYGVRLSISVPTASETFGLKYFILNLPLGSFLFSGLLAGTLYDIEAAKDRKENVIPPLLTTLLQIGLPGYGWSLPVRIRLGLASHL
ncbi:hypothetical protein SUGI_1181840 [Cryptomeria japonica]|nr:hypothetical protein SUGI_1181840 [Cryptomeria japonica]